MQILVNIFIFYAGFYFYRLAENHHKNKWLFGFLGVLIFVISYILFLIFCRFLNSQDYNVFNLASIGFKAFFVGLVFTIIIFQILSFIWSRKEKKYKNDVDKIGKNESRNYNDRR